MSDSDRIPAQSDRNMTYNKQGRLVGSSASNKKTFPSMPKYPDRLAVDPFGRIHVVGLDSDFAVRFEADIDRKQKKRPINER